MIAHALVTGAAGFIGAHVVRALVADGARVRALVRPGEDLRNLRGLDVELREGDVRDDASVAGAVRGVDHVFHLAAVYSLAPSAARLMHDVNVVGTQRVLDHARRAGVRRVVHTSSIARFAGRHRRATERDAFGLGATGNVYARTKADAHAVAEAAAARGDDVVIVAPTGPIGPGDVRPTPTGKLLLRIATLPVVPLVRTRGCFADVRDMAQGHVLAAKHGARGETYLLGTRDLDLWELALMAASALGRSPPLVDLGHALARWGARASEAFAALTKREPLLTRDAVAISEIGLAADGSKAVRELKVPTTPLEVAVRDAFAWFVRERYV
jgi:dihydroflavonol-4-reductase